ncbi:MULTISPECIES: phage holin family protein [unclassified Modestobacter]|uniref:phage holin family protein n=1 Tax=unclassified Modestobacter TaxID=2643866 RepID=UPI0022AA0E80|nr:MULTISPECIES: phage holin family protein [unclassified Modestobacter]MCZ2813040.1 phage holin family protein [Modestobacter sp. VKM Ac-2979]MCZ2819873.1 phage holin family protein [Modestobacter sp. VKM Ac-2977]MCZ2842931.1 phage holin family protein [Modestobacter sp. VKM Ac-2980]MCZ2847541.1 phage holin family protein [Modestobacter sp. VKM Ac-2978]
MSQPTTGAGASRVETPPPAPENASTGQLIGQLSDQLTRLVRDEMRLAQAEVSTKAKKFGLGAGLFGGAGLFAFLGLQVLVAAAVLALALVLPGWLAAVIVAVVLFVVAAVLALIGKKDVQQAAPPVPTEAIASVKTDVATVKESASR